MFTGIYEVSSANQYKNSEEGLKTVQVKVREVLYNNQVCSLVLLQDLTHFLSTRSLETASQSQTAAIQYISR